MSVHYLTLLERTTRAQEGSTAEVHLPTGRNTTERCARTSRLITPLEGPGLADTQTASGGDLGGGVETPHKPLTLMLQHQTPQITNVNTKEAIEEPLTTPVEK